MKKIETIQKEISDKNGLVLGQVGVKSDSDIVIVCALRTAQTRAKKGLLKDTKPEQLLSLILKGVLSKSKMDPKLIQEVVVGNVLLPGSGALIFRGACLMAGLSVDSSMMTVNRFCSSGLEAISVVASKIKTGLISIGIAAGVESMSLSDMSNMVEPDKLSDEFLNNELASNCLLPMGITSENITEKFGLKRETLDQLALESQQKASKAQKQGLFKEEIWPVETEFLDEKKNLKKVLVDQDDGIRGDTTLEGLGKLKPAFKRDGKSTGGNSSQVTDGASACIMMTRAEAKRLGLPILGKILSHAAVGVPPEIMGVGPAYAIPRALQIANVSIDKIDIFEINEAFASQCFYCIEKLGIPKEKVNPKGGAIAIGHPLGSTGCRQLSTLLTELKRTKKRLGVISMCIGTGMGAAAVFEAEF